MHSPVILNNSLEAEHDRVYSNVEQKEGEGLVDSFNKQVNLHNKDGENKEMESVPIQEEKKKEKKVPAPRHMSSRYQKSQD